MTTSQLLQSSFIPAIYSSRHRGSGFPAPVWRRNGPIQAKIREIFMPALSSTMTEGKIVSWIRSEGDKLTKGESVVVVESDKADMDVESFYDGYLAAILVNEGLSATVGSTIALLAETEEEIALAQSKIASGGSSSSAPAADLAAPAKAIEETPPIVVAPAVKEVAGSAKVEVGVAGSTFHPASEGGKRVVASPYAKKLAKESALDLKKIRGTGPNGRVIAKDIDAYLHGVTLTYTGDVSEVEQDAGKANGSDKGSVVPFSTMQSAVSRNMLESLAVPVFRVGYTVTTNALDDLYKKIKSKGVTKTALLAKAAALAIVQHPVINSSCIDGKSFTYNSQVNIAVAVAIDGGLITPVLHNADKIDIYSLSRKWNELVEKAKAKQLQPNEYTTGTFTLSNLGMYGVDRFDAILPPGTGAIMAVGSSIPTAVGTKDGRFGFKYQMQVNATADHRIIYGADLAAFLQTFAKIVEDPKDLTL